MPLVSSGVEHGNLRELALARMKDLGTQCRDVRTREVGIQEIHHKVKPYEVRLTSACLLLQLVAHMGDARKKDFLCPGIDRSGTYCFTVVLLSVYQSI